MRLLRRPRFSDALLSLLLLSITAKAAAPDVVLNELMYNPPGSLDDLQYIELFNKSPKPVNLDGWHFKTGLEFVFPTNTPLIPGGFLVLSKNPAAFRKHFGANIPVLGPFKGKLKHGGERIELVTASGTTVDSLQFKDRSPWPIGPDGFGPSLERIVADGPSASPDNWAASKMPQTRRATGSPGKRNDNFAPTSLPNFSNLVVSPARPGQPVIVECDITDDTAITNAVLRISVLVGAQPLSESEATLQRIAGTSKTGRYRAEIAGVPAGSIVRYKILATGLSGLVRALPGENEPAASFSYYVGPNTNTASIPFVYINQFGSREKRNAARQPRLFGGGDSPASGGARGNAFLLYAPTNGTAIQVFDQVRVVGRKGGWKVHFRKDQPFEGMTDINVIFEYQPRYVISEHMAYELFRKAGLPSPHSEPLRVWMDGRPVGYHLLVEQPNRHFLKRSGRDEDANLYKILWYGQDLVGQHEKKTNPSTGHEDLKRIMAELDQTQGQVQWAVIEKNFNVPEFINYYAVNMCIQNWDGFFNNHSIYHDLRPGGKWGIIPWDEDKTWGDHDGASSSYDWYDRAIQLTTVPPTGSGLGHG